MSAAERGAEATADIALLRGLLAGASDAPWQWLDGEDADSDELQDGHGEMVASGFRDDLAPSITDGRLCAALRNAAPELLDHIERVEAELAAARALLPALESWYSPDPWERDAPGDGLVTTNEGYRCYACGASTPYLDHSQEGTGWWDKPDHNENAPHNALCLWEDAAAFLAQHAAEGEG